MKIRLDISFALYSDGFYFNQNKNNFYDLFLFGLMETRQTAKEKTRFIYDTVGTAPFSFI